MSQDLNTMVDLVYDSLFEQDFHGYRLIGIQNTLLYEVGYLAQIYLLQGFQSVEFVCAEPSFW